MNDEFKYQDILIGLHGQIQSNHDAYFVRERMAAYCESWNTGDLEKRKSLFEENATFCDPMNSNAIEGLDALYGFWVSSENMPGRVETKLHSTVASGDNGLLDFTIIFHNPDDSVVNLHVREVFAFSSAGKIKSVEAYWDDGSINKNELADT